MKVELSLKEMIELLKLASLGKLTTGIIHNLNSPLQNIGMDIELAAMFLKNKAQAVEEITASLTSRLERMEKEFDRINHILKNGTIIGQMDEVYLKSMTLNLFLEQILKMLEANLYFKHNVDKETDLRPDLPKLGTRSDNFWLAIIWFMQSMVDNIEQNEIKKLRIKTDVNGQNQEMVFRTGDRKLSDGFLKSLNNEKGLPDHIKTGESPMLDMALYVLRAEGVVFRGEDTGVETIVTLYIHPRTG